MRQEEDFYKNLSIHTRLENGHRVSSIYRRSSAIGDDSYYWETFEWEMDHMSMTERIVDQFTSYSLKSALRVHEDLYYTTKEDQT